MINKIFSHIFLASPILITSFFLPYSKFPAWAITLILSSLIVTLALCSYIFSNWKKEKAFGNLVINTIVVLASISAIAYGLVQTSVRFGLFGKGIVAFSTVTFLSLVAAFFLASQYRGRANKLIFYFSIFGVVVTLISFLLIKFLPVLGNYFAFATIPMVSFGLLLSYPLFFSLSTLLGSAITFISDKKSFNFTYKFGSLFKYFYAALAIVLAITLVGNVLRFAAANYYLVASNYAAENNLEMSKSALNTAIAIAPFDTYYLARAELTKNDMALLLSSQATDTEKLKADYTKLINFQIADAKRAVAYDNKNPQNYLALGLAYESAIPVIGEEGYLKALESYDAIRAIVTDKDYVDTIKAKLAFGAAKDEQGLLFLDNALSYNASSGPALYASSQYFTAKKDFKLATEYAEKAVSAYPAAADARVNLGLLYFVNKELPKAIEQFKVAFKLNQNDNISLYYLAAAYKANGNIDFAKQVIEELAKRVGETEEVKNLKDGIYNSTPTVEKKVETKK